MTKEDKVRALLLAYACTVGRTSTNELDGSFSGVPLYDFLLGMLEVCGHLDAWVKNTSYQWHKAQSLVIQSTLSSKSTMELYLTTATHRFRLLGKTGAEFRISPSAQTARIFQVIPEIEKLMLDKQWPEIEKKLQNLTKRTSLSIQDYKEQVKNLKMVVSY